MLAFEASVPIACLLMPISLLATCCGLGLFQVVVFHHCSHGTVFARREHNRNVGRLISALLLFKHFDAYKHEHMLHHNARKLLTDEDEFADFVLNMCRLEPQVAEARAVAAGPRRGRLLAGLPSALPAPAPPCGAAVARRSPQPGRRRGMAAGVRGWPSPRVTSFRSSSIWVLPVTVLLQMATVGRILCEHRFPEPALIAARGREFVCRSTAGVFPGSAPPDETADTLRGLVLWAGWWLDMLTRQLFVRLFVLVGDAPCHDFHHRRPAGNAWTSYIHARQKDVDAGCPGYPLNYGETWGLFRAIDENLETLANTPKDFLSHQAG